MASAGVVPWREDVPYRVQLGSTFSAARRADSARYHTLQFSFRPASLGTKGLMQTRPPTRVILEFEGAQANHEGDHSVPTSAVVFKGTYSQAKDVECGLIWTGDGFCLERLASTAKGLRPVRASKAEPPAKRPKAVAEAPVPPSSTPHRIDDSEAVDQEEAVELDEEELEGELEEHLDD